MGETPRLWLRSPVLLGLGCAVGLTVSYLLRFYGWPLFENLGTYPGDIWYAHSNYGIFLREPDFFRIEYPLGVYLLLKFSTNLTLMLSPDFTYEAFLAVNSIILALFGMGATLVLWKIQALRRPDTTVPTWKLWVFWVLSPSFIFFALINFDLPAVFFVLLAVYFHLRRSNDLSALYLGLGMFMKLYPVLLVPLFILGKTPREAIRYGLVAAATWLALNMGFMIVDFESWSFSYVWQMTREPTIDGLAYLLYHWVGSPAASAFFPLLYAATIGWIYWRYYRKGEKDSPIDPLLRYGAPVLATFLLANRIYSPQYILWVLPFLIFVPRLSLIYFYIFELTNLTPTLILFSYIVDYPLLSLSLRVVRYFALAVIYAESLFIRGPWATEDRPIPATPPD